MKRYCLWCMSIVEDTNTACPVCGHLPGDLHPESHHLPPGSELDRYIIGRVLGQGGFGITYIGMDTRLERRVAVKEYFPTFFVKRDAGTSLNVSCYTGDGERLHQKGREKFLQEARTLAKLDDIQEIVRVQDFFPANNTAYIVMEFLEGETFKQRLNRTGPFPVDQLLGLLEPVLRAMGAMHAEGIIHRDISPDNLMILNNGRVKLMDFGCARDLDSERSMTIMLKHGFAPVEQYTGHGQGPWSDLYSLCATAYTCMTGKIPPRSVALGETQLEPPSALGVKISKAQEDAVMKGMALSASKRWQSAGELYLALYGKPIVEDGEASATEVMWHAKGPVSDSNKLHDNFPKHRSTAPSNGGKKASISAGAEDSQNSDFVTEPANGKQLRGAAVHRSRMSKRRGLIPALCVLLLVLLTLASATTPFGSSILTGWKSGGWQGILTALQKTDAGDILFWGTDSGGY